MCLNMVSVTKAANWCEFHGECACILKVNPRPVQGSVIADKHMHECTVGRVQKSLITDKHMHECTVGRVQGSLIADKHMHGIPAPVQGSLIADKHMHKCTVGREQVRVFTCAYLICHRI